MEHHAQVEIVAHDERAVLALANELLNFLERSARRREILVRDQLLRRLGGDNVAHAGQGDALDVLEVLLDAEVEVGTGR